MYHSGVIRTVRLSRRAEKDLARVPSYIAHNLHEWIDAVGDEGLEEVRKVPGYHDEPLLGGWWGHRSIRLNRSYRAIYRITGDGDVELAIVERVNKHEY